MNKGWYIRFSLVVVLTVIAGIVFWPSLGGTALAPPKAIEKLVGRRIALGLDIRGGLRLVYEVEVEQAVEDRRDLRAQQVLERLCEKMGICTEKEHTLSQLERARERVRITGVGRDGFRVQFKEKGDIKLIEGVAADVAGDLREMGRTESSVTFVLDPQSVERLKEQAIEQARETISERIDELGLREAAVMTREDTIIIELPGANDEQFERIRTVISRTARLEFKIVDDEATFLSALPQSEIPEGISRVQETVSAGEGRPYVQSTYLVAKGPEAKIRLQEFIARLRDKGLIPDGHELLLGRIEFGEEDLPQKEEMWRTYTLHARAELTGDAIADAMVANDPQDGSPYVALTLDAAGAEVFERLTAANVKRRMAIVLDDRVESAPVIQSRIGGGRASITLGKNRSYQEMLKEASELVVVLRAGALPAPIRPANEQRIGPSLGADAIEKGIIGAVGGIVLVLVFMAFYYEVAGLIADLMVLLNVLFLLAILAAFEATLTLPGIAGIALTVGMAVDANVLIAERMREEMRLGRTAAKAVSLGFDKAFWSILDSQLTTFIAGVVLFQYGSGPIKGFAVTLMVGIVTSVFTGVFCSRVIYDWLIRGLRIEKLRVG
ncbi:MAG: protein translocase subunit SecD [Sandaracinaceae bacterium]|nr:protein translocase subunit SecD [Sandaracinaceae bacterium]